MVHFRSPNESRLISVLAFIPDFSPCKVVHPHLSELSGSTHSSANQPLVELSEFSVFMECHTFEIESSEKTEGDHRSALAFFACLERTASEASGVRDFERVNPHLPFSPFSGSSISDDFVLSRCGFSLCILSFVFRPNSCNQAWTKDLKGVEGEPTFSRCSTFSFPFPCFCSLRKPYSSRGLVRCFFSKGACLQRPLTYGQKVLSYLCY